MDKEPKKLTAYELRELKKKEEARKQRNSMLASVIIVCSCIILTAIFIVISSVNKKKERDADLKEFVKLGETSVSRLEFNYFKYGVENDFIYNYNTYLQMLGFNPQMSPALQIYDESTGETWDDFFNSMTVDQIRQIKALSSEMKEKQVTFDVKENLDTYFKNMKATAESSNTTLDAYLQYLCDSKAATKKRVSKFVEEEYLVGMYYNKILEDSKVSDEDVQAEYDAHPEDYETVDYHVYSFIADVTEEMSSLEEAEAMIAKLDIAKEMEARVKAGEDFEGLCFEYAPEAEKTNYNKPEGEEEESLEKITGLTVQPGMVGYAEWLFDKERVQGETDIYADYEDHLVYVVRFDRRYYDDSTKESIRDNLTYNKVNAHLDELKAKFTVVDTQNNLPFYKIQDDTAN